MDVLVSFFDEYSGYTFSYSYVACTSNTWYLHEDSETGVEYIPLLLNHEQGIYDGGISTESDILVSKWSHSSGERPSEISFQFARLGTIVEVTLWGLKEGDILKSGTWYTGDTFMATCDLEEVVSYNPETGRYRYGVPEYMLGMVNNVAFHSIDFSCTDDTRPIVADADGKASLYLRCLPGMLDDCFGIICTVDRDGEECDYSRIVSLSALGRSLEFKDAGLTTFQVKLYPAQAETLPESVQYTTSESADHDGFMAVWEEGAHLSGYECYYKSDEYSDEKTFLSVETVSDGYVGVVVPSGMEPGRYYLYVKGIPDAESGPQSFDTFVKVLAVGTTVSLEFAGCATPLVEGSDYYQVTNRDDWYPECAGEYAFITASNTDFGTYYGSALSAVDRNQKWGFRTAPSQEFPGGLVSLTFTLGKWYDVDVYNEPEVYGILADQTEVRLDDTVAETVNDKQFEYDLSGYAGFRISCAGSATLYDVYLNYYK